MSIVPFGFSGPCDAQFDIELRCFSSPTFDYSNPDFASSFLTTENIETTDSGLIYPNPALDSIRLKGEFKTITIYDALGKAVMNEIGTISGAEISINGLGKGLYQVVAENEIKKVSQKLLVQ